MTHPAASPAGGRHRLGWALGAGLGGLVAAIVVLAAFSGAGDGLLGHQICVTGPVIVDENVWTPFTLANSPYLGWTAWNASFTVYNPWGLSNVTLSNGFVGGGNLSKGYFQTQNWSVSSVHNASIAGPGVGQPCKTAYVATLSHPSFSSAVDLATLQGPGNMSNALEPATFSPDGRAAAEFFNGFVSSNRPAISTCGEKSVEINYTSKSFDISIPISGAGGLSSITVAVPSVESFTYFFPANTGTWTVDDLQQSVGSRGPGLAFSWQAC